MMRAGTLGGPPLQLSPLLPRGAGWERRVSESRRCPSTTRPLPLSAPEPSWARLGPQRPASGPESPGGPSQRERAAWGGEELRSRLFRGPPAPRVPPAGAHAEGGCTRGSGGWTLRPRVDLCRGCGARGVSLGLGSPGQNVLEGFWVGPEAWTEERLAEELQQGPCPEVGVWGQAPGSQPWSPEPDFPLIHRCSTC